MHERVRNQLLLTSTQQRMLSMCRVSSESVNVINSDLSQHSRECFRCAAFPAKARFNVFCQNKLPILNFRELKTQFLRSVFPIAALVRDFQQCSSSSQVFKGQEFMTSSVHLLSRGRTFVTFHLKYYFVKDKKDGSRLVQAIVRCDQVICCGAENFRSTGSVYMNFD